MYSAKINEQPTEFGTSGLLYRSNKLMFDRATLTLWTQFAGEPVIGPLADSGIELPFFPSVVITWQEWLDAHPDTKVMDINTGIYPPDGYPPESDPSSVYYRYRTSPDPGYPVWHRVSLVDDKAAVLGLTIGGEEKAYPIKVLSQERIVNDTLGGMGLVVISSGESEGARVYERRSQVFAALPEETTTEVVDSHGTRWQVTEDFLVNTEQPAERLPRLPSRISFWFGWYAFNPSTALYEGVQE